MKGEKGSGSNRPQQLEVRDVCRCRLFILGIVIAGRRHLP